MAKSIYPKEWDASQKEKDNGWNNNPKILSEIVDAINNEMYVEDESEMMEFIDHALTYLKLKYFKSK